MKKVFVVLFVLTVAFPALSHKFITEILVEDNTLQFPPSSQYNYVQSYSLTEDQILNSYWEQITYRREVNQKIKDRIQLETLKEVLPQPKTILAPECEVNTRDKSMLKTCGQFDHFNASRSAAIKTCFKLNKQNPGLYPSGLIPLFSGPATFVDMGTAANDHHVIYDVSHGLQFSCVEVLLYTE